MQPYYFLAGDAEAGYFGLDRSPLYPPELLQSSLWSDLVASLDGPPPWSGFFTQQDVARTFQAHLAEAGVAVSILGVRELSTGLESNEASDQPGYLGLDVATLEPCSALRSSQEARDVTSSDDLLWDVVFRYAHALRNQHGLLDSLQDARYLRDVCVVLETRAESSLSLADARVLSICELVNET